MTEKIMDDDNDRCHDNFNQNFGNFYEQKCQKIYEQPTNIVYFE